MTAAGELLLTQIGERRLELDVAGEPLVGGTHRRVPDVVTDTRERSEPNEIAATQLCPGATDVLVARIDRKSTRLNSSHSQISYAVFCLKKKNRRNGYSRTCWRDRMTNSRTPA